MNQDKSAVTGLLGRRSVYSAIIKNQTSEKIHCFVEYQISNGTDNEVIEFDINANEEQKCEEKTNSAGMTSTNSSSSNVFPKVIHSIEVKKSDGSSLSIKAPFDNLPHEDARNWKFTVDDNKIHSGKN
jgi:hypothetical protein